MFIKKSILFLLLILATNITFAQRSGEDPTEFVDSVVSIFRGSTNSAVIVGVIKMNT